MLWSVFNKKVIFTILFFLKQVTFQHLIWKYLQGTNFRTGAPLRSIQPCPNTSLIRVETLTIASPPVLRSAMEHSSQGPAALEPHAWSTPGCPSQGSAAPAPATRRARDTLLRVPAAPAPPVWPTPGRDNLLRTTLHQHQPQNEARDALVRSPLHQLLLKGQPRDTHLKAPLNLHQLQFAKLHQLQSARMHRLQSAKLHRLQSTRSH
jgi:hypothetical protein